MNSVNYIKQLIQEEKLTEEVKITLKNMGPPRPYLGLEGPHRLTTSKIKFNIEYYKVTDWLCGCPLRNALFCYICLVINNCACTPGNEMDPWILNGISSGVTALEQLKMRIRTHQKSSKHMSNSLDYALLGKINQSERLSRRFVASLTQHNERVRQNRHVLSRIIDCVKFSDDNTDVSTEIGTILKKHVSVGLSETELLDSIHAVCLDLIRKEIEQTDYVSLEVDESTDSGQSTQLILIVRYELAGKIHERFLGFITPENSYVSSIASSVLEELKKLGLEETPEKLISQSYDGVATRNTKQWGIEPRIKSSYKNAHFIHSYSHRLDLIIERAASQCREAKIFFANLENFSLFFSNEKSISVLDKVVEKLLPRGAKTQWNFESLCVITVFVHKNDISECLDHFIDVETERSIVAKAVALKNLLNDRDFNYWLDFFSRVMPNCDELFNRLQQLDVFSNVRVRQFVDTFQANLSLLRRNLEHKLNREESPPNKRLCRDEDPLAIKEEVTIEENDLINQIKQEANSTEECDLLQMIDESLHRERLRNEINEKVATEICNIITDYVDERFAYTDHLLIASLVQSNFFSNYQIVFPKDEVKLAATTFKLNEQSLKNELTMLYWRDELSKAAGELTLLQYLYKNNLTHVFPETVQLLKIVCTMPITTSEPGRCFSTLTRVKSLVKNGRNHVLAVCLLARGLMEATPNFNDLVIEHFGRQSGRQMDFTYEHVS